MDSAAASVFLDAAPSDGGDRGRDSLFLLAQLKLDEASNALSVRVRNLSPGGLMAELPDPVVPDSAVQVELRGLGWITGRVAWQTEGRVGIAFDRPVDPQRARKPVGLGSGDQVAKRPLRFPI